VVEEPSTLRKGMDALGEILTERNELRADAERLREMERVVGTGDSRALRHLLDSDPLAHALFTLGRRWERQLGPRLGGEDGDR